MNDEWDSVTVLSKSRPKQGTQSSKRAITQGQRSGNVDTRTKFNAGTNAKGFTGHHAKLDRETEELKHKNLGLDVGKLIQKGRQGKEWTQKELATKINVKPQIINEYELGKAIPDNQVIGKIERAIGIKLRGKDKGMPMGAPKKK